MAKLTCPVCETVLTGLPDGFYCPRCDERYDDDAVMPPASQGAHQRDKRKAQNVAWRSAWQRATENNARQLDLLEDDQVDNRWRK